MTIPDFQSLMRPLLAFAADGGEKSIKGTTDSLAKELKLTDDELHQLLPSGKQSTIGFIGLGSISTRQAQSKGRGAHILSLLSVERSYSPRIQRK
jgi:restriction endonuclease Mrr